jgi:hypothetical protein
LPAFHQSHQCPWHAVHAALGSVCLFPGAFPSTTKILSTPPALPLPVLPFATQAAPYPKPPLSCPRITCRHPRQRHKISYYTRGFNSMLRGRALLRRIEIQLVRTYLRRQLLPSPLGYRGGCRGR